MESKIPIKLKEIKGRVTVLRSLPHKDYTIIVRRIDKDMFEYLVSKTPIYSSWIQMKPRKGKTHLSKTDVKLTTDLIMSGGMATVDMLVGEKLDEKKEEIVKTFEKSRDIVSNAIKGVN
jgi:hypothetical protein